VLPRRETVRAGIGLRVDGETARNGECVDPCEEYAAHGGVWDGDALALRMRCLHRQPLSMLARWIVGREVVCFERFGATLLPAFQFDAATFLPRPCVRRVVRELRDVYDDEELARWFVSDNGLLDDRVPADVVVAEPDAVLEAARAGRFIARW
jgi:hypothetical protein